MKCPGGKEILNTALQSTSWGRCVLLKTPSSWEGAVSNEEWSGAGL